MIPVSIPSLGDAFMNQTTDSNGLPPPSVRPINKHWVLFLVRESCLTVLGMLAILLRPSPRWQRR